MTRLTAFRDSAERVSAVIRSRVLWQFGWRALRRSAARDAALTFRSAILLFQNLPKRKHSDKLFVVLCVRASEFKPPFRFRPGSGLARKRVRQTIQIEGFDPGSE